MIIIASKMVLCLAIASFIGFLIGIFVGRRITKEVKSSIYKHSHDFKVHGNVYDRPIILSKPRPTGKDDLKEIGEIDERTEEALNQLGIFHYDQISKWSTKNCDWINEYLSLENRINEEKWVEQAIQFTSKNKNATQLG